ncbi:MAG: hypothetical protein H3C31_11505 [Brumimicrobium sp.]|nr:hypothetical protein [Brumimicrobium sp.]MCO5269127.1 hypothetical protein [Brumimicrobium sp.]
MKKILLKTVAISLALFTYAQTTLAQQTIVEFDGANNEFVITDWTVTGPGFPLPDKISITANESGTLAINNNNTYKNITVKVLFKKQNQAPASSIMCNYEIKDNNGVAKTKTGLISDNTSATENVLIYNFNNSDEFKIKSFRLYNPDKAATIVYIKISGTLATLDVEDNYLDFKVIAQPEFLTISSEKEATLSIFTITGQSLGNYIIHTGDNTIMNNAKGVLLLVLTDEKNAVIGRKKIMK